MAYSFGTSGSQPLAGNQAYAPSNGLPGGTPSTPAAKALAGASSGNGIMSAISGGLSSIFKPVAPSTVQRPSYMPAPQSTPGLLAPPPTNQDVKSQTVTDTAGNSHTTAYHPTPVSSGSAATSSPSTPAPVDVSSFTPDQLKSFNAANALGSGVQTIGTPQVSTAPIVSSSGGEIIPQAGAQPANPAPQTPVATTTTQQTAAPAPAIAPTYIGLVGQSAQAARASEPVGQSAAQIAADYGKQIADVGQAGARAQGGYLSTGTSPVAVGNAGIIASNTAQQQQALASGESAALQGTGQQLTAEQQAASGLLGAAGAIKPTPAAYGQTVFDPATGTYKDSSGNSDLAPQTQGSQLAKLVTSGQMDYPTAVSQMGQYGAAGTPALRNAILAANPNFNFNLSASSAQTQAAGQQLQTQSDTVNQALDTLNSFFTQLSPLQTQGIPLTNDIAQTISGFLGSGAVSQYNNALNDTRTQIQNILGTMGVTPTDSGKYVKQYLPDGMTTEQLSANIAALKTLISQKVENYKASGQQQTTTAPAATSSSGNPTTFATSW